MSMEVTSPVFNDIRRIPKAHSCGGKLPDSGTFYEQGYTGVQTYPDTSPQLDWTGVPEGAKSLALIMDSGRVLGEGDDALDDLERPRGRDGPSGGCGDDDGGAVHRAADHAGRQRRGYGGVRGAMSGARDDGLPPFWRQGKAQGDLHLRVSTSTRWTPKLDLGPDATKETLLQAMEGHVIGGGEITGQFAAKTKKLEH